MRLCHAEYQTNPQDDRTHIYPHNEALNNQENQHFANDKCLRIIKPEFVPSNNLFSSAMDSRSSPFLYDPYDMSSDDEDSSMPINVAQITP
jgi:hypothetical protein